MLLYIIYAFMFVHYMFKYVFICYKCFCMLYMYLCTIYVQNSHPEYSLEGLMLRLKLQYFGHLM